MDTLWTEVKASQMQLTPPQFEELRQLIYRHSGIYFSDQKLYLLEGRLFKRIRTIGLNSFNEYLNYLHRMGNIEAEMRQVFDYVTINETYFLRYDRQLLTCVQEFIPRLLGKNGSSNVPIRIWSAGCSSGEEPYSLAMLIEEQFSNHWPRPNVDILATDISSRMLKRAQEGLYTQNSFRNGFPSYYLMKYFQAVDGQYRIKDTIKSKVRFDYLNLNDLERVQQLRGRDIIFCRNVLIYFDEVMKKKVIRAFYDILNHGGYLFLGEAESLHGISSAFEVIHFEGGFCYRKE